MTNDNIYSLLSQAALRFGRNRALEFGEDRLTYAELDDAARRTATLLAELGAEPGERVAFCFSKSMDAVVALFGIARTGATYVPLDPSWPAERINAIVEDAGIRLWVGGATPPAGVSGIRASATIRPPLSMPDNGAVLLADARRRTPMEGELPACASGLANILYTSGSTGRPKGVEITALSLFHFARWGAEAFGLTPDDRLSNHAPYNFDLSTFDIFAAVAAGATMCPVPESLKMFPYQMAKFIAERRISVWYSVPSALAMMQLRGKLPEHDISALRHVIFAGEVMPKPMLKALAADLPRATLTNLYGPTETNACTWHRITREDLQCDEPVPIGRPISDTRLWIVIDPDAVGERSDEPIVNSSGNAGAMPKRSAGVLDARGMTAVQYARNAAHTGVEASGELWVAGPTVTTGYFGDAEMTRMRRVPAPDGDGLAWRTGDRVQMRPDGVLLFEGRMDRMIKARGHRIEPGEIEAALCRHPAVRQAAVVPLADPVFGSRIKACLSLRDGAAADEAALAAHCREHLPAYMMPDAWQFYEALPETDRGKVDLLALQTARDEHEKSMRCRA